jgi:hypothetical protein
MGPCCARKFWRRGGPGVEFRIQHLVLLGVSNRVKEGSRENRGTSQSL